MQNKKQIKYEMQNEKGLNYLILYFLQSIT